MTRTTALALGLLVLSALLYPVTFQTREPVRFEIGSMDWDTLGDEAEFYDRARMNGPIRHADGRVELIEFYARLTTARASFRLPYHATATPLRLFIRSHRFGLQGTVDLVVNGEPLGAFVFGETSYPWGGIRAVIPQKVAERGPLVIELETRDGLTPPEHLPKDLGLGVDWIELEPMSQRITLSLTWVDVFFALLFPGLGYIFARWSGASERASLGALLVLVALVLVTTALFPFPTRAALRRLWVVFPMGLLLLLLLRFFSSKLRPRLASGDVVFLSQAVVVTILFHSVLIFFPDHAPPDLWNHLPQVEWLDSLELSFEELYRFSSSSDPFDDGHVRPHFGVEYGAPYPPFFYLLTHAASFVHGDRRFLIEFLAVVVSALLMLPVFLIARTIWKEAHIARFAILLLALEISIWHHAHRVHAPGTLGGLFVLLWLYFVAVYWDVLASRRGFVCFAALSMVAVLSYAASLVQLSILAFVLVALLYLFGSEVEKKLSVLMALGFGAGLVGAVSVYYGPYIVQAFERSELLLDRDSYDPPATFYFLRNQMRDTVRILRNGYLFYVALSVGGWILLGKSGANRFHRLFLIAWGLTYLLMLVFKDPALFPMLFLHVKEDLFYATLACLLGGLVLAWLWRGRVLSKALVVGLLVTALGFALRDQALNRDTLHDQTLSQQFEANSALAQWNRPHYASRVLVFMLRPSVHRATR